MSDNVRCDKWIYAMAVTELKADTREVSTMIPGQSRYTQRYHVVRVRLEGADDLTGEVLVASHDAPKIGDQFTVTIERLSQC